MVGNVGVALLLTLVAGLSTGVGGAIAYFIRKPKRSYLSFSLGLSAGVMVYISFMNLLAGSIESIGESSALLSFFLGVVVIALIDLLVPEQENPHEYKSEDSDIDTSLLHTGTFTAFAIAIHNFPEGMATFGTALADVRLGAIIAVAIAIHNIPEGISVSIPFYYSTGDRKKAFFYSLLSGLAEPAGALMSFLILMPYLTDTVLSRLLAFVAGIMIYISFDELLPLAHDYGKRHLVIIGLFLGMLIMALSLMLL